VHELAEHAEAAELHPCSGLELAVDHLALEALELADEVEDRRRVGVGQVQVHGPLGADPVADLGAAQVGRLDAAGVQQLRGDLDARPGAGHADQVDRGHQTYGLVGGPAARRADPHPGLDLGVLQGLHQVVELALGEDRAAAVELEGQCQGALPVGCGHLAVDQVGQHRVDQALDLDHHHRPGFAVAVGLGARRPRHRHDGRERGEARGQSRADLRYSPAHRRTDAGG
jgi:hypothetical protein